MSFAEEMQTKITFPGGNISLGTFHHENMHQWWGDNVSEDKYERTFFKEGYADLSEGYNTARTAANAAGGLGTPAGDAAFDNSLVTRFNTTYNSTSANTVERRAVEPDEREPVRQPDLHPLRPRPTSRCAQILGKVNFDKASKEIQTTYGGGSITQPQQIAIYKKWMPNQSIGCIEQARRVLQAVVGHGLRRARPAAGNKPHDHGPGSGRPAASMTPTAAARTTPWTARRRSAAPCRRR